jgi:hypothetical protein
MKQVILDTFDSTIDNFLYYDRKEDEDLGIEELKSSLRSGEVPIEELKQILERKLSLYLGEGWL